MKTIRFAGPVLDAGLPIDDKPIAITKDAHQTNGYLKISEQIFTCSALRFAQELAPSKRLFGIDRVC